MTQQGELVRPTRAFAQIYHLESLLDRTTKPTTGESLDDRRPQLVRQESSKLPAPNYVSTQTPPQKNKNCFGAKRRVRKPQTSASRSEGKTGAAIEKGDTRTLANSGERNKAYSSRARGLAYFLP